MSYGVEQMSKKQKDPKVLTEEWIEKVLKKWPENAEKYDYSKVVFEGSRSEVQIHCNVCGADFTQQARKHLEGQGCRNCRNEGFRKAYQLGRDNFIKRAREVHGDKYDYSKVEYKNEREPVCIICPKHGEFWQAPGNHLNGQRCDECYKDSKTLSNEEFISRAKKAHEGENYDYSKVEYTGSEDDVTIICSKHGEFTQRAADHLQGKGCSKCVHHVSSVEVEMFEFVKAFCPDAVQSDRTVLEGKELDIFIPSKHLAIEVNGIWWHNDKQRDKRYHFNKFLTCKEKGIRLIQITDYEWNKDRVKFEKLLKHALGVESDRKVNARQCEVIELSSSECKDFYNTYHLQGYAANPVNIALKTKDGEIVAIMSFGFGKTTRGAGRVSGASEAVWELSRFATACAVRGGASRLFKAFVRGYNPESVRSFSMNDWFSGGVYESLGFTPEYVAPDYRVFHPKSGLRPKPHWQRRNIPKRLKEIGREDIDFNPDKAIDPRTEFQIEDLVGALRIWDSGKIRWTWRNTEKDSYSSCK